MSYWYKTTQHTQEGQKKYLWRTGSRTPYRYQTLQMPKSLIENHIVSCLYIFLYLHTSRLLTARVQCNCWFGNKITTTKCFVYGIITRKNVCVCVFSTNTFFYIYLCWGGMPVEERGQPAGAVLSLWFWGLNSCIPLLAELCCWPLQTHFLIKCFSSYKCRIHGHRKKISRMLKQGIFAAMFSE